MLYEKAFETMFLIVALSLNPYSIGICSMRLVKFILSMLTSVLILILLEYAL